MSHGSTWSDTEVSALITVWGEADVQKQLDGATRNQTISANIAKKLEKSGCRAKINNLKAEY